MKNVLGWLADHWYVLIFVVLAYLMWAYGESQYDRGHSAAQAIGDKALADLREEHQKLRADAAEQNLVLYRQQVERANQAELVFLDAQDEIGRLKQQLTQERINRVSTQYAPARGAAWTASSMSRPTAGCSREATDEDLDDLLAARRLRPAVPDGLGLLVVLPARSLGGRQTGGCGEGRAAGRQR